MTVLPLAGYTVGVTAARRREELGAALERRGARVMYGPAMRLVPLADDTVLHEATVQCLAAPLDVVVVTTGVGFRGWTEAAEAWGLADGLTARLAAATILTRGPKALGAVRAAGLREAWSPESESSAGMLAHLLEDDQLFGQRIAVQLHGEPLDDVVDGLRAAGAEVIEVPVYRWVSPVDERPLHRLLEATANRAVDAMTFTSAPAAANFLRTAAELGIGDEVAAALRGPVLCVAVGPVTAAPLERAGIPTVQPERARLGALVRTVAELLPQRDVTGGTARFSAER
jgi:uroporphyrinogen-III synthase